MLKKQRAAERIEGRRGNRGLERGQRVKERTGLSTGKRSYSTVIKVGRFSEIYLGV
jgi:hypothetical protein